MDKTKAWYKELRKPTWAPPSWIFGPVWSLLYLIIAISYGFVAYQTYVGAIPVSILIVFALNLIFNFFYTPIQFWLHDLLLAAADIAFVLLTLVAALVLIYPYAHWVALVNIPYVLWVSFATILHYTITFKNRDRWIT